METATKGGKKVTKPIARIRTNSFTSDSALAVLLEKHKLEPTGIGIVGSPVFSESPFVRKMEMKYGHLFGKFN